MEVVPYSLAIENLMYTMVSTRPKIAHVVGIVSTFLSKLGKNHWKPVKWILRYLEGTLKLSLYFLRAKPILEGYTNSDPTRDLDGWKSILGCLFIFVGRSCLLAVQISELCCFT